MCFCLLSNKVVFLICVFFLKIAFWTVGFVLSQPSIHKTIMEGISSVFGIPGTKTELNYILEETSNSVCSLHVLGKFKCP